MKIGHKLILGFLIVALLIMAVGYLAVNSSQKQLQKIIGQKSITLATEKSDKINGYIHGRLEQVQAYAKNLSFEQVLIQSNNNFDNLDDVKSHISQSDQQWVSVPKDTLTDFMQRLISNQLSEKIRQKFELKQFYKDKYGHSVFSEVFVTNKYGANAAQTQKTTDYYQADEKWWQTAKQHGVFVGDVEYDKSADVYALDLAVAIHYPNGNFAGVIKAVLNIQEVIDVIKQIKYTKELEATEFKLLTKDGKVIYSTEEHEFLEDLPDRLLRSLLQEKEEGVPGFIVEGDKPGEGDELFVHAHSKGYRDFKSLGWILVIEHETNEIFAPISRLKYNLLIISLSVAALAVLLGLVTSASISKPITKLKDTAAKIGEGNLDARIEIKSNDEIGQLAASFNDMADKLKQSYEDLKQANINLEENVQQRTEELSSTAVQLAEEIADRRQIEDKQRQSEEKYRVLFESADDALFIMDVSEEHGARFLDCNERTLELFGCTHRDQIIGKTSVEFSPPTQPDGKSSREKAFELANAVMEGHPQCFEWMHYRLDGTPFWVEVSLSHIELKGKNYMQAIVRDITERKETEEALEESEEKLKTLLESSPDVVVTFDKNGKVLYMNHGAGGHKREDVIGKNAEEFLAPEYHKKHNEILKEVFEKGKRGEFEHSLATPEGPTSWRSRLIPIKQNGKIIMAMAISTDITERKQAETVVQKLNEDLEATVEKLTIANREFRDLAYVAAHDLKSPLKGIRTLTDWISTDYSSKFDEEGKQRLDLLMRRVDRMYNLIDGILQFSGVGHVQAEKVNVNLNDLVPDIIDSLAPPKNISITFESQLPVIECEESRITQVFRHLLSNSVKYMDKPKGQIKIACVEENGFWKFSIKDNGPGIKEKYFDKIFQICQTLSPRDEFESTGIGLAVAKKIIEMYGGKIWIESTPPQGSTFFFTLPKQKSNIVEHPKPEANIVS